jgi:hypothetical protein
MKEQKLYCVHFTRYDERDKAIYGLFINDKLDLESPNREFLVRLMNDYKEKDKQERK